MSTNEFKLERLNSFGVSQKGIKFLSANSISDNITVNNIQFNTAGASANQNYSENWGGFKRLISVDAILHNDGTDKSTEGSNKVTLLEQKRHITDSTGIIQGTSGAEKQYQTRYRVTLYVEGVTETITGTIEDITITGDTSNSMVLRVSFNLFEAA